MITCCIFSKSRHGRCIWCGRGVCLCLLRGDAALAPPSTLGVPPSLPPTAPGDPLDSPAPPADNKPSRPLLARLSIFVGGETERRGLWASRGGEVLNWTGGRDPVVNTHTSSSLLPENKRHNIKIIKLKNFGHYFAKTGNGESGNYKTQQVCNSLTTICFIGWEHLIWSIRKL